MSERRPPIRPSLSRVAVALACAAAARATPAQPDEQPGPAAPAYEEEVVVRAPTRLEGWPGAKDPTVQVVERSRLQATGARTLQDALQRVAGLALSDEQGNALQQDLAMRGLTASPVTGLPQGLSVFLDGVRVNEPAVEEVNFDLLPLEDVERVEIVRGPHAVFGRNTLAGAVNIVTRRGGEGMQAEAEVEGGSSLYQAAHGRVSGPLGPFDGYLSVGQLSGGGWRAASAARGLRAFGKLGARREDADATLSYQLQQDRIEEPGSLPLSLLTQDRTQNYTPGDFFRPTLHLVTLNARQRVGPGLALAVNGFFRALDGEQFNSSFLTPDTRLFNATRSLGAAAQLEHRADAGALRSQLSAGLEATRNSVRITVHEEPNGRPDTGGDALPRLSSDVADIQHSLGVFLQEHAELVSGPLTGLSATLALRYDRITHGILDRSPDDPGKATGDAAFSRWVPAAGLSWAFASRWRASASYAQGFRAPAFLELTCADPAAPCIGLQAGVAPDTSLRLLRPVRSRTLEVGLSVAPADGVAVALEAFRIDLADDIFAVTAPGTTRVFFRNVGDTRRQGVELSVRGERRALEGELTYAYTRATFESDLTLATPRLDAEVEPVPRGAEIPLTPRHRLSLGARLRALTWLRLSAGLVYVGAQRFLGDEANVAPTLAPYAILRAGAEATWKAWTAFVRATNLLDTRYESFGTFAPNGRAPPGAGGQPPIEPFLTPGPPLRLVAGIRWELG